MKSESIFRRLLSMMLVIAMICTLALPALAADETEQTVSITVTQVDNDSVTAKIPGRTPAGQAPENAGYSDKDVVRVSIILEKAGAIDAGYSPEGIATNKAAASYQTGLEEEQDLLIGKIEAATGTELDVVWNLTLAANLISANVPYGQIEAIEAVPGVRAVVIETRYEPDVASAGGVDPNMATSGEQIGTSPAWAAGYTGAGTKIAIIDTGLDVEHEAFNAGAYTYSLGKLAEQKGMTADAYIDSLELMDEAGIQTVLAQLNVMERMNVTAADLYVNEKVPFGFNYVDSDLNLAHYNSEHGSHVAGISAANTYVADGEGYADALDTTFVKGVAPDAQLLIMKVFGTSGGAYDADYMAAIEDAILLGADTVNLSLGSGNPGMSRCATEEYQKVLESLVKCGVVVTISAGNSGSWVESAENGMPYLYLDDVSMHTGGSPGTYTNSLGVASVDNSGFTSVYMEVDGNKLFYAESTDYGNAPMTTLGGEQEYVFIDGIGTPEQFEAVKDILAGKIALCYRGETSFFEKANAAVAAGAKGVIIVNNQDGIIYLNLTDYKYTAPVVSLTKADGEYFKAAGTKAAAGELTYWTGKVTISDSIGVGSYNQEYYTMSAFSSWGVPGSLEMKPEITAPGGSIYSVAGYVPGVISGHNKYEMMSGTSMAAPQVAGMAALVMQYIREEGLVEKTGVDIRTLAQSLLMSTAEPILDGNNNGYYYPVLQQGAGLANVGNATSSDSYILMNKDATDSYADGKVKAELGDDPAKTGVYTFSFTINNLTDVEKTFALSADIFTQGAFVESGILFMDTWTTALTPNLTWTVNGKVVENGAELEGMDFNGDGVVNTGDGQTLLDYATGLVTELENEDKADLNADGKVNSYDAYLFLSLINESGATVPAKGSATVSVTIDLSDNDEGWLANYENGAYIEGYVFAESLSTSEGVSGTVHSIPVLGFYGNWSDASMYDRGSMVEYQYGLEQLPPYLLGSVYYKGYANGLLIQYNDAPGKEYVFGGNPMVPDATYMPERNAISAVNGDKISMMGFTTIRNAAVAHYQVWNEETGAYYINESISDGPLYSAFYYTNGGTWENVYWQLKTNFNAKDIPNNTRIQVGVTAALEYYVDDEGNVAWDKLGKGATFSMPMTVDNTAPTLDDVAMSLVNDTLNVKVTDNQYVAAVALYDIYGQYLYTYQGSKADQAAGDTVDYALDLTDVNGPSFLLQVYDYANNVTTYKIETQIGEVVETIEKVEMNKSATVLQVGNQEQLTAIVYPVNASERGVTWKSSDENVATVDENGVVTAVAEGTAQIIATSKKDDTKSVSCALTVIDIDKDLNGIVWDEDGSIWFSEFSTTGLPEYKKLSGDMLEEDYFVAATVGPNGVLYASSLNTSTGTGAIYAIDTQNYTATKLSDCVVQNLHIFYSDLTYAPAMLGSGVLLATYGPFVIAVDPSNGEALLIIDQYDSELVGISTCYGDIYAQEGQTQDCVYLIQNDGTVIQEVYVYLAAYGQILPYYYYMTGGRASFDCGVDVGDAWYFNSVYYDGEYLFWSAHETDVDDDVTLYAIDADYTGNTYTLGKFAPDVWPVCGLHELGKTPSLGIHSAPTEEMMDLQTWIEENGKPEAKEYALEKLEIKTSKAAEGNSASDSNGAAPQAEPEKTTITMNITAKDAAGAAVDSNNGVSTITYDKELLELVKVTVGGKYTSVNEQDGSVTIGYVDLDGFAADETVATLVFQRKNEIGDTKIDVEHKEVGDQLPAFRETTEVPCEHKDPTLVGAKEATCTEDGYTGDLKCACGHVVTPGQPIKAEGHNYKSTYANGVYTFTCQKCKDSYTSTNPATGDAFDPMLIAMIMTAALAAVAGLVIVGKKRRMF